MPFLIALQTWGPIGPASPSIVSTDSPYTFTTSTFDIYYELKTILDRSPNLGAPLVLQVHQLSPPTVLLRSLRQHLTYYLHELKAILDRSPDLGPTGPASPSIVSTDSPYTFTTLIRSLRQHLTLFTRAQDHS
jgi:hypothetical protein